MKKSAFLLALIFLVASFTGCGEKKEVINQDDKYLVTAAMLSANNDYQNDDIYKFISDKFNVTIDFQAMSTDSFAEKSKILISSGSMPDIMFSNLSYVDYISYSSQGMLKQLPDDYETKYPNIAKNLERTLVVDKFKEAGNGKLYGIMNAMSFGVLYGQDNDVNVDRYCIAYRKDWAKKLGIEVKPIMKYEDFINLAKAFKEADLGNVGKNSVTGIAVNPDEAPNLFVTAHNANYNFFYKKDGKYVCGYNDPETLEGIKAYREAYEEGILSPGFYALKYSDVPGIFLSGKAGLYFNTFGTNDYQVLKKKFADSNPGLDPNECIGLFWIEGKDGIVRGREEANYWSGVYFSPDIDEEIYARCLEMIDYCLSPEGSKLMTIGFKDKDYTEDENGKITVTISSDKPGVVPNLRDIYPSVNFFTAIAPSTYVSPSVDVVTMNEVNAMLKAKLDSNMQNKKLDLDIEYLNADKYNKFIAAQDINALLAEVVVSEGDVAQLWNEKLNAIQKDIDEVCEEINNELK